jgi:hypothetical protein
MLQGDVPVEPDTMRRARLVGWLVVLGPALLAWGLGAAYRVAGVGRPVGLLLGMLFWVLLLGVAWFAVFILRQLGLMAIPRLRPEEALPPAAPEVGIFAHESV